MSNGISRLLRRVRCGQAVVVVSGLPRSGTSMVMQMLDAGGLTVATDGIRTGDEDNPRGYLELERVKELHRRGDRSWVRGCRGRAVKVISFLLRDLPRNLNYRVIFIERDLDEVLLSQKKMLRRRGEKADAGSDDTLRRDYERHLADVRSLLDRLPGFETLTLRHRDIIEGPADAARRISLFLGGGLDEEAMAAAVDSSLYRNRPGRNGEEAGGA